MKTTKSWGEGKSIRARYSEGGEVPERALKDLHPEEGWEETPRLAKESNQEVKNNKRFKSPSGREGAKRK